MTVTAGELRAVGEEAGLDAVGFAPAGPFTSTRAELQRRRAAGLHAGMAFTYRNPARSTDPGETVRGARALVVGARSYGRPATPPGSGPSGRVARYARTDHYGPLRDGLAGRRRAAEGRRVAALSSSPTTTPSSTGRRPTAPASAGTARTPTCCCPAAARGSCSARSSPTRRSPRPRRPSPTAAGRAAAASTRARPAPSSRPASSTPAAAWRGSCSSRGRSPSATGRRSATASTAATTARRSARPTSAPPAITPTVSPTAVRGAWVPLLELLGAGDDELLDRYGRWYIPGRDPRWLRRNAVVALGNVGDGSDPAVVDALRRTWPTPTRCCAATPCGPRPGSGAPTCSPPSTATRSRTCRPSWPWPPAPRAGEAPARHQRLPAQGRRHPVVPLGALAAAAARRRRRLTTPYDGARRGTGPSRSGRARSASRCSCRRRGSRHRIDSLADEVGAELVVLDPALPLGLVGPTLEHPYAVVLHGAEVTVPGRLPGSRALLGRVLRRSRLVIAAGGYPAAEAARAAGVDAADRGRAAGRRRRPVPAARRRRAGQGAPPVRPARGRPPDRGGQPARAPQGVRRADRRGRAAGSLGPPVPGGHRRRRSRRRRLGAPGGGPPGRRCSFLGRVPDDDLPALYGCADVFAMCCREPLGRPRAGGVRHRVPRGGRRRRAPGRRRQRRRRRGGRRRRDRAGGPAPRGPRGRGGRARRRLLDDAALQRRMGEAARRRAVSEFTYDNLAGRLGSALDLLA